LYLRGRALLLKRGRHAAEAGECLQRAVDLDPGFAPAWSGLADMFTVRAYYGLLPPADSMPRALAAARRAVALDPQNAEAHAALAMPLMVWERDYDAAEAAFCRSIELNPHYTQGRAWHALFSLQWVRGLHDESVAEARRVYDGDPLSAYAASILGLVLACAGQTEEGMALARLGAERDPDANLGHWVHGLVAHWSGALNESVAALDRALAVSNRGAMSLSHQGDVYADLGRLDDARALHQEIVEMSTRSYVPNVLLAISAAALGDRDQAFELLQRACDEREPLLVLIARVAPNLRRLRDDPRFADVRRRLALPA
jgi:tetratricopeptide (TPR) repeat protein